MNAYITIEKKGGKVRAGYLMAKDLEDANHQMVTDPPNWSIVLKPSDANQLIIDLNKMVRRV
jgi:hypothetical protein